jgi:hypothetical protein
MDVVRFYQNIDADNCSFARYGVASGFPQVIGCLFGCEAPRHLLLQLPDLSGITWWYLPSLRQWLLLGSYASLA